LIHHCLTDRLRQKGVVPVDGCGPGAELRACRRGQVGGLVVAVQTLDEGRDVRGEVVGQVRERTTTRRVRRKVVVPGDVHAVAAHLRRAAGVVAGNEGRRNAAGQELRPGERAAQDQAAGSVLPRAYVRAGEPRRLTGLAGVRVGDDTPALEPVALGDVLDGLRRVEIDRGDEVRAFAER